MAQRILIVEDEEKLADYIQLWLEQLGYECARERTGSAGLRKAGDWKPDLLVLDLALPEMDGWEVCRRIRQHSQVPIIMVTARGEEMDRVHGLRLGADDYLVKPFSFPELVARIEAVLRRSGSRRGDGVPINFQRDGLDIDFEAHRVWVNATLIHLTPTEFRLLAYLATHHDRLLTHRQILQAVWGPEYGNDLDSLRMYVRSLRRKIEDLSGPKENRRRYITTEYGIGYRFG